MVGPWRQDPNLPLLDLKSGRVFRPFTDNLGCQWDRRSYVDNPVAELARGLLSLA